MKKLIASITILALAFLAIAYFASSKEDKTKIAAAKAEAAKIAHCDLTGRDQINYWEDFADVDGESWDDGFEAFTAHKPATLDWITSCGATQPDEATKLNELLDYNDIWN